MSLVITIGRQYGAAGIETGKKIAEILGIKFYDKELVEIAAEKSNLSKDALDSADERATNSFLYSVVSGNCNMRGLGLPAQYSMPINDKLFIAQTEVIKEIAKEDCVIVGRCADYALEHEKNVDVLSVFIYASQEYRIQHVMNEMEITRVKARDAIVRADKRRRHYYEYYTGKDWGVMTNYNMCLDVEKIGIDNVAAIVADCAAKMKR